MSKEKNSAMDAHAKDIRRQIGTQVNRRFLSRMPQFAVDNTTSDEMNDLLGRLERAERMQRSGKGH